MCGKGRNTMKALVKLKGTACCREDRPGRELEMAQEERRARRDCWR